MKNFHDKVMQVIFENIPEIKSRAMFGGYGLYKNSIIFGLIAEGNFYFKVDATNIADYRAAKSKPFTYVGASGRPISMSYWKVPTRVLKDEKILLQWINKSVDVNLRKSTKPLSPAKF